MCDSEIQTQTQFFEIFLTFPWIKPSFPFISKVARFYLDFYDFFAQNQDPVQQPKTWILYHLTRIHIYVLIWEFMAI
jgi:hypothetical protein